MSKKKLTWIFAVPVLAIAGFIVSSPASAKSVYNSAQSTIASNNRVDCRLGDSHTWSHLGGDPVWSGGINSVSQLAIVVKSPAGQRSLTCLGLNETERRAVTAQINNATRCTMQQGQRFIKMAFHRDGASVDGPTTFVDPRYPNGAPAFCLTAMVKQGNMTENVSLLWPWKCVNAALVSIVALVPPVTFTKPPRTPKPGIVKLFIRKQAFSAADEEQLIFPTPTNVFRFKVQCGLSGKPRYIMYQSDPQYAGICPVTAGRARFWELSTLGPDKWETLSPVYQTFTLKGKKTVMAVFKDKQIKRVTPPPPPVTTTTTTVTTTTTTSTTTPKPPPTTTTPKPENCSDGSPPPCSPPLPK